MTKAMISLRRAEAVEFVGCFFILWLFHSNFFRSIVWQGLPAQALPFLGGQIVDEHYASGQIKKNGETGDEYYENGQLKKNGVTGDEFFADGSMKKNGYTKDEFHENGIVKKDGATGKEFDKGGYPTTY